MSDAQKLMLLKFIHAVGVDIKDFGFEGDSAILILWAGTWWRVSVNGMVEEVKGGLLCGSLATRLMAAAYRAVLAVADRLADFTSDDIWPLLERSGESTHEPAALGPVMLRAAKDGMIEQTGEMRQTRFARRHRKLTVWRKK